MYSLPFIDKGPNENLRKAILKKIGAVSNSGLHDSIKPLEPSFSTPRGIQLEKEVAEGYHPCAQIFNDRYNLSLDMSVEEKIQQLCVMIEYVNSQLDAIEIVESDESRKAANAYLVDLTTRLRYSKEILNDLNNQINEINLARQRSQIEAQPKLDYFNERWNRAINGLLSISIALRTS
ncbi:hypothetical protein CANCADRAFT_116280 [Tortispora caseinolytica NRRL Y-17796]|uniref:Uncharacterized protein n=1 Tax=Tortispora caseinolytica NRRL Y-17796 TaxID=767744 RepID=A0A1E4TH34_9ASCO|nr:hypothetical protein CANCADRAFT_116280 [Tortispora caseinolytica NRRL Y-17796]